MLTFRSPRSLLTTVQTTVQPDHPPMCHHSLLLSVFLRPVPNVQKIVYSTCSVHAMENEEVVKHVLNSEECKLGRFRLAPRNEVLPSWPRRGLIDSLGIFVFGPRQIKKVTYFPGDAGSLIRCSPGEDATNGFFVSCFVKEDEATTRKRDTSDNDPIPRLKKRRSRNTHQPKD